MLKNATKQKEKAETAAKADYKAAVEIGDFISAKYKFACEILDYIGVTIIGITTAIAILCSIDRIVSQSYFLKITNLISATDSFIVISFNLNILLNKYQNSAV